MKSLQQNAENGATPGKPMSQEAFESLIKEAEEGEFHTLEESKKIFKEWRLKRVKQKTQSYFTTY